MIDANTLRGALGPVNIGPLVIAPPPGLHEWSVDVELGRAGEGMVTLHGQLDPSTGVAAWKITRVDRGQ